jgi:hypothetical protein
MRAANLWRLDCAAGVACDWLHRSLDPASTRAESAAVKKNGKQPLATAMLRRAIFEWDRDLVQPVPPPLTVRLAQFPYLRETLSMAAGTAA